MSEPHRSHFPRGRGGRHCLRGDPSHGGRMSAHHDHVLRCTELLRTSPEPMWARMRALLEERGVSASTSALATSFADDTSFEFGIVVTSDRRVYQFGFDYLHKAVDQGVFTEWVDLT